MKSVLTSAQWVNALEAVNVAINAAGKYRSCPEQAGLRSALRREPAVNEGAGGRCSAVVARPGVARPYQQHHVPVMLRCGRAGPRCADISLRAALRAVHG